jgi:hypothetical protein
MRIIKILDLLEHFGSHSWRAILKLEMAIHYFENAVPDFPKHLSLHKAAVKESIMASKASKDTPVLINLTH